MLRSSLLPVSLKMVKLCIGQPLLLGSCHPIVIVDLVVPILNGTPMLEGTRHAYIVETALS